MAADSRLGGDQLFALEAVVPYGTSHVSPWGPKPT